jgi:hypothetical protein
MAFVGALVMAFLAIVGLNFLFGVVFGGSKIGAKVAADAIKQKNQKNASQPAAETQNEEENGTE